MCGFCGQLANKDTDPSIRQLNLMARAISSRGRDAQKRFINENISLLHNRLAIIDVSNEADQPFHDCASNLTVVFNGCLYNHNNIRNTLCKLGHKFRTQSDTEVLIKAWYEWGVDSLNEIQGMYSFVIYDHRSGDTILCRDHFGMKPLYYTELPSGFYFSSSLNSFLDLEGFDKSIDPIALHHYLTLNSIVPPPRTILDNVKKIPPASIMVVNKNGNSFTRKYWEPQRSLAPKNASLSIDQWAQKFIDIFEETLLEHTNSDVNYSVLLSGGLDSSIIVGLLSRNFDQKIDTYSIGFEDFENETGNEFEYSDVVSKKFDTNHTKILIDQKMILDSLPDMFNAMAEPMISHDCIGFFLMAQEVAKDHKVTLSGQGADELFAGYHWYPKLESSIDPIEDYSKSFFDIDDTALRSRVNSKWIPTNDVSKDFVRNYFEACGELGSVEKALSIDSNVMMIEDPIKRVDNMCMASGVEGRLPFLDKRIANIASEIPVEHKLFLNGKGVIKRAAESILPESIVHRAKGYFPVPQIRHLKGDLLEFAYDSLSSSATTNRGIFKESYLHSLKVGNANQLSALGASELWKIASLEYWLQQRGI